ncbi:nucleotide pyrophosphohydrolase [Chloroflexota bacterium]
MASDKTTRIIELRDKVRQFIEYRDWTKYHNPKDVAISIAIEAGELLEIFQWVKESEINDITKDPKRLTALEDELADVLIYCISLANVLDTDIAETITKKMEKNIAKYPVRKVKGNYKKYTEL